MIFLYVGRPLFGICVTGVYCPIIAAPKSVDPVLPCVTLGQDYQQPWNQHVKNSKRIHTTPFESGQHTDSVHEIFCDLSPHPQSTYCVCHFYPLPYLFIKYCV